MFKTIFIEEHLANTPRVTAITERYPNSRIKMIRKVEDVFGVVKRPYLQKRESLNLFLGEKKGQLVKLAPEAYGTHGDPHYYYVHAYNCIYECNYCYLQGFFNSPDIVLYINHEEILAEIKRIAYQRKDLGESPWFHAGEYSDSLALSHITREIPEYFALFEELSFAKLELRTKSANISQLLELSPKKNIYISFSLSPEEIIKENDLKTPHLNARLAAIKKLVKHGHPIGIHLDPIIYTSTFKEDYQSLLLQLFNVLPVEKLAYVSIGVVRFTKEVLAQVKMNYPDSLLLKGELTPSENNLIRYSRPMRKWILSSIKELLISSGVDNRKVYECMEG